MGATTSLLILRQLEDKKVCLDFYINFLQEVGIWDRVRKTLRNGKVCLEMFFQVHHVGRILDINCLHARPLLL